MNLTVHLALVFHVFIADYPIYSVFGSRMGFSRSADRMALFRFDQIQDGEE